MSLLDQSFLPGAGAAQEAQSADVEEGNLTEKFHFKAEIEINLQDLYHKNLFILSMNIFLNVHATFIL